MGLGHGVLHAHVVLPVHGCDLNGVRLVRHLRRERRQGDSAAVESASTSGGDHISAHRTHIPLGFQHVCRAVPVDDLRTGEQLRQRNPQCLCQRFQQGDVRQSLAGLPLGNGLVADKNTLCQLLLGHAAPFPQHLNGLSCDIWIHGDPSFLLGFVAFGGISSIADFTASGNLRSVACKTAPRQTRRSAAVFMILCGVPLAYASTITLWNTFLPLRRMVSASG